MLVCLNMCSVIKVSMVVKSSVSGLFGRWCVSYKLVGEKIVLVMVISIVVW